jgi:predicted Zn finger-like uncharacterized protein
MQFVCNNCQAKYTISAERVQGRVLKIRCRECGRIIEVRGDGLATAELLGDGGGRKKTQSSKDLSDNYKMGNLRDRFKESFTAKGAGKLPSPAAEPGPETPSAAKETTDPKRWYVAVRNQPVGPISKKKVKGYLRRKEILGSSLVWREGFDDWKPLEKCTELSDLIQELAPAPTTESIAEAKGAPDGAVTPGAGPFDESQPPPQQADDAMRGFYVGRIDAQQTVAEVAEAGQALEHDVFRPAPHMVQVQPTLLKRLLGSRVALLAGGALAVLIGFGVTLLVVGLGQEPAGPPPDAPEVIHEETFDPDHSERGDILAGLTISLEEVITEELKTEAEVEATDGAKGADPPRAGKKKEGAGSTAKTQGLDGTMPKLPFGIKEKTVNSSDKTPSTGSGANKGQNGLSDSQIRSVVTKNSKTIKKCYEKVLGKGIGVKEDIKVKVRVNVGTSGMVTKVKVIEISQYGNFLTPCIEAGLKGWVFPRADQASEFVFPILLTPKN